MHRAEFKKRLKHFLTLSFYISSILVICFNTSIAAALDDDLLDKYSANNIMFYDPDAGNACTRRGSCKVYGDSDDERLWSALRNVGFSPEEAAAIMGNTKHEGGTPTTQEYVYNWARDNNCNTAEGNPYTIWTYNSEHHAACMGNHYSTYGAGREVAGIGLGMVQWTSKGRSEGYLEKMRELGLLDKYFEGDAYKTYGALTNETLKQKIEEETGSDGDYWALYCAAINFIYYELKGEGKNGAQWESVLDSGDVDTMAEAVARLYEVCATGCLDGASDRRATALQVYQDYKDGVFDAVEAKISGSTTPNDNSSDSNNDATTTSYRKSGLIADNDDENADQTDGGKDDGDKFNQNDVDGKDVTIIGDSVTNGSRTALEAKLSGIDIHAQDSKQFYGSDSSNPTGEEIVNELAASNSLRTHVVIALGTNNTSLSEDSVKSVIDKIGQKNIWLVLNYDDYKTDKYDANNATLGGIATAYKNVNTIDWPKTVADAKTKNPGTTYIKDEQPNYSVHPTNPEGTELFAQMIYDALSGFDNTGVCDDDVDAGDPLSYAKQFIIDTNYAYNRNYEIPTMYEMDTIMPTPGSDEAVSVNPDHASVLSGLFTGAGSNYNGCWSAQYCGQCTALSGWFVDMMTEYSAQGGNGNGVVGNLADVYPDIEVSETPTPLSVFSEGLNETYGHTGLVMEVKDDGTVITLENNIQTNHLMVRTRSADSWRSGYQFAKFPAAKIHLEHLGKTYE